ncbi:phage holin family protein [Actinomadura kijaniata]|uniref:phage holin family protein n=1 Tax=Actinomadura kijaniata TaxID=46161 RepID=UPI000ABF9DAE
MIGYSPGMKILIRVVITAVALWTATALVDGIDVGGDDAVKRTLTFLAVGAVFGIVNAVVKPLVRLLGCALYVLTLGLFALVVNAALLALTGWLSGKLGLEFHVRWFWPALWGAVIVSVVSWLLSLFVSDD